MVYLQNLNLWNGSYLARNLLRGHIKKPHIGVDSQHARAQGQLDQGLEVEIPADATAAPEHLQDLFENNILFNCIFRRFIIILYFVEVLGLLLLQFLDVLPIERILHQEIVEGFDALTDAKHPVKYSSY